MLGPAVIICLLFIASTGSPRILRVPGQYHAIQSALNDALDGDTILVASGTYAEALTAPPHHFVLKGDVANTWNPELRPVLDPAPLAGSDTLACLMLPATSRAVIEDFNFRNGRAMYPRAEQAWGGIVCFSSEQMLLRRCRFDSVYCGIKGRVFDVVTAFELIQCDFLNCQYSATLALTTVLARECGFQMNGGVTSFLSTARENSVYDRCHFFGHMGIMLAVAGSGNRIEDCVFGPGQVGHFTAIQIVGGIRNRFTNNVVSGLRIGGDVVLIDMWNDSLPGEAVKISGNRFYRNGHVPAGQTHAIRIGYPADAQPDLYCTISDNTFELYEGGTHNGLGKAIVVAAGKVNILRNRFYGIRPKTNPVIFVQDSVFSSVYMRDNIFVDNGLAMLSWSSEVDAAYNYWGDASGPLHRRLNPFGWGDEIRGEIVFWPWLADTTQTSPLLSADERMQQPVAADLQVHPNPFNHETKIVFTVSQPGIYYVDLFDVTGRIAERLWSGPVADEQEVTLSGERLASGVYFVRLTTLRDHQFAAAQKLVLLK